jgi:hypothetical protein
MTRRISLVSPGSPWQRLRACRDLASDIGGARETFEGQVCVPLYVHGRNFIVELLEAEASRLEVVVDRQIDRIIGAKAESRP